jgi:carbonic anhydrase
MKKIILIPGLLMLFLVLIVTGCKDLVEEFVWHYIGDSDEPPFLNGWQNWENGFDLCAYGKDSVGFVHLKGM